MHAQHAGDAELHEMRADCDPVMGSEDFGVLARHVPACLAFLGNGTALGKGGTPLHSYDYVFNDDILTAGVDFYVQVVRDTGTAP